LLGWPVSGSHQTESVISGKVGKNSLKMPDFQNFRTLVKC
jgi:hypothetical protein